MQKAASLNARHGKFSSDFRWLTLLAVALVAAVAGCEGRGTVVAGGKAESLDLACARRVIDGKRCLVCVYADGGRPVGLSCEWAERRAP